jgi:predicted GIY-YIG superfamily endonuclease
MFVYFVRAGNRGAVKIGIARNVERRVATLQTGNAFKLNVMAVIPCSSRIEAQSLEERLHKRFAKQRIRGEWFQGNIDFRRIKYDFEDTDTTSSAPNWVKSNYDQVKNAKKKRRQSRLK